MIALIKRRVISHIALRYSYIINFFGKQRTGRTLLSNPVKKLYTLTYDGRNEAVHNKILYFEKGFNGWYYWRCYTPFTDTNSDVENPSIAVSNDGFTWCDPKGLINPIVNLENKSAFNSDPHLVYNDETKELECWYRYCEKDGGEYIYRVKSRDGILWSRKELLQFSKNTFQTIVCPVVIFHDGIYRIWVLTNDNDMFNKGSYIKYYESIDALEWKYINDIHVNVGIDHMPWHFDVVKRNGIYHMVYSTRAISNYNALYYIVYAYSLDNINYESKIILERGKKWYQWDNYKMHRPSLVWGKEHCLLYYSAQSKTYNWGTGVVIMDNQLFNN